MGKALIIIAALGAALVVVTIAVGTWREVEHPLVTEINQIVSDYRNEEMKILEITND